MPFRLIRFLLDQFTHADLRAWKRFSDDAEEYHVRLHYHLEAKRILHMDGLIDALHTHKIANKKGKSWYRIVDYKYSNQPLSCVGSLKKSGRFNIGEDLDPHKFPAFPALYLAENHQTAFLETFGVPLKNPAAGLTGYELALRDQVSFAALRFDFELSNLFDLTKAANLREFTDIIATFEMPDDLKVVGRKIGMGPPKFPWLVRDAAALKKTFLRKDWRMYPIQFGIPSNPQVFGRILRDAGFEGVIYPSTKGKARCLAIFIENLDGPNSHISLQDPAPTTVTRKRLDSDNWKQVSAS